jgi:hypothetical protein
MLLMWYNTELNKTDYGQVFKILGDKMKFIMDMPTLKFIYNMEQISMLNRLYICLEYKQQLN